ncbi:MAG: HD domain-containing protein [Bacillota bacterium]
MEKYIPTREEALKLFLEYNTSNNLLKHALAVESVMLHFAEILHEEEQEKWGIIGLVHDLDYEKFPDQHCLKTKEILEENNWPQEYIHAVVSHGWKICVDVEPVKKMEKVLYTVDELTGLIAATALMRPNKSILDTDTKSVKKKWKQKGFAAGVNREVIEEGALLLGMDLDYIIEETINGMRKVAAEIGLKGDI